jgi:hypothetical protein
MAQLENSINTKLGRVNLEQGKYYRILKENEQIYSTDGRNVLIRGFAYQGRFNGFTDNNEAEFVDVLESKFTKYGVDSQMLSRPLTIERPSPYDRDLFIVEIDPSISKETYDFGMNATPLINSNESRYSQSMPPMTYSRRDPSGERAEVQDMPPSMTYERQTRQLPQGGKRRKSKRRKSKRTKRRKYNR